MKSARKYKTAVSRELHKTGPHAAAPNPPAAGRSFYMAKPRVFVHGIALDERVTGEAGLPPAAKGH